jgi:hypothetical protein
MYTYLYICLSPLSPSLLLHCLSSTQSIRFRGRVTIQYRCDVYIYIYTYSYVKIYTFICSYIQDKAVESAVETIQVSPSDYLPVIPDVTIQYRCDSVDRDHER